MVRDPSRGFEGLKVYRLAEEMCDLVWELVRKWDVFARETLGRQLVRSADSVGANIAEGVGRESHLDNRRFVFIARGSLFETRHHLRRAFRRNLLGKKETKKLSELIDNLSPMLNAYIRAIPKSGKKATATLPTQ